MARTPSNMTPLGLDAPHFDLIDTEGHRVTLEDARDARGLLVMFICTHCPFVIHLREALAALGAEYLLRGIKVVAINSNDVEKYPQDGPEGMREERAKVGYIFPYLFDEDQEVAMAYNAACTPDFFLFDHDLKLAYRGQFDGSRPGNQVPVDGRDLRRACDQLLETGVVDSTTEQIPSLGCNIKWKQGNDPEARSTRVAQPSTTST
jgi:peroxiredoxin